MLTVNPSLNPKATLLPQPSPSLLLSLLTPSLFPPTGTTPTNITVFPALTCDAIQSTYFLSLSTLMTLNPVSGYHLVVPPAALCSIHVSMWQVLAPKRITVSCGPCKELNKPSDLKNRPVSSLDFHDFHGKGAKYPTQHRCGRFINDMFPSQMCLCSPAIR